MRDSSGAERGARCRRVGARQEREREGREEGAQADGGVGRGRWCGAASRVVGLVAAAGKASRAV